MDSSSSESSSRLIPTHLDSDVFRLSPGGEMVPLSHMEMNLEREMNRMKDEMSKMMDNMQGSAAAPPPKVDDARLSENVRMENPIQTLADGSRKFKLQFDLGQFKPEEIQVRTAGNTLTVSAKHDEKDANKSVSQEFNKSYELPKGISLEQMTSKLSNGGLLTIEAPILA